MRKTKLVWCAASAAVGIWVGTNYLQAQTNVAPTYEYKFERYQQSQYQPASRDIVKMALRIKRESHQTTVWFTGGFVAGSSAPCAEGKWFKMGTGGPNDDYHILSFNDGPRRVLIGRSSSETSDLYFVNAIKFGVPSVGADCWKPEHDWQKFPD